MRPITAQTIFSLAEAAATSGLSRRARQAPTAVIFDLTEVPYIDSSGIATLIEGLKIARNRQIAFCLQGLQGRLLHLFEVTGVLALFKASGCIVRPVEKVS